MSEDKIEVGEYVRTEDGKFGIFDRYSKRNEDSIYKSPFDCFIKMQKRKTCLQCAREYIVKHSKNIIDLIEVGDYVNGKEVKHIAMFEGFPDYPKLIFVDENRLLPDETCENKDIKSIVTKEQFDSVAYTL